VVLSSVAATGQQPSTAAIPRTADRRPDLSGIWQAMNSAAWNVEDHKSSKPAIR
jgi:hypothetical protein